MKLHKIEQKGRKSMFIFGRKRFNEEVEKETEMRVNAFLERRETEERLRDIDRRIWKIEDDIRELKNGHGETPEVPVNCRPC